MYGLPFCVIMCTNYYRQKIVHFWPVQCVYSLQRQMTMQHAERLKDGQHMHKSNSFQLGNQFFCVIMNFRISTCRHRRMTMKRRRTQLRASSENQSVRVCVCVYMCSVAAERSCFYSTTAFYFHILRLISLYLFINA